jgi:hypothetical protein
VGEFFASFPGNVVGKWTRVESDCAMRTFLEGLSGQVDRFEA